MLRRLALIAVLLVSACKPAPPANAIHENGRVFTREPIAVYPDAAYVELYYGSDQETPPADIQALKNAKPVRLTPEQRARLEAAFSQIHIYSDTGLQEAAACFIPHHFFRYYDKNGRQVGEVSVCFCCRGAGWNPSLLGGKNGVDKVDVDIPAIEALVKSMDLPTDIDCY